MTPARFGIVVASVAAALAAAYLFWPRGREPLPLPPPPIVQPAPKSAEPKFPLQPTEPAAQPLPPLKESDASMLVAFEGLIGSPAVQRFLLPEELIRRIVATLDNLPREAYASRLNPVRPAGGLFLATGRDSQLAISPKNAARYTPYVRLLESVDVTKAVDLYVRFYPLFQEAYVELGYPNAYFNDRLVEVIDHLVAAPEPEGSLKLTVPHVLYEYADPELESRSAGHKLMMRAGRENAARIKACLRDFRREIVSRSPAPRP